MTDTLEFKGRWKIPDSSNWINGTLFYNPNEGSRLELFGTFSLHMFDQSSQELIVGETTEGQVTLLDNWYKSKTTTHNDIAVGLYEPSIVLIGHHFFDVQEIKFSNVIFRVFNLFQWLEITGLKHDFDDINKKFSITYSQPNIIDIGNERKIILDAYVKTKDVNHKLEITEQCSVSLDYKTRTHFKEILYDIRRFTGFITLCTFEQSYPLNITFKDSNYKKDIHHLEVVKDIQCLYHNPAYNQKHRYRRTFEHLVKFKDIEGNISSILKKWHDNYEKIKPTYDLMLYSFRSKKHFRLEKFMDTVRAIETFHRRTEKNHLIPKKDYKAKVKNIIDNTKPEYRDWLKERLMYGNEPTLRNRLTELISKYQNSYLESQIVDIDKFCQDTVRSRNYYTHYNESLKRKALTGTDLYYLNRKLMGLLISCLLSYIGLENSQFETGLLYLLKE